MPSITPTLQDLFTRHRVIFWYTEPGDASTRAEFEAVNLPAVHKRELDRNAFVLKRELLSAAPDDRYLVFSDQERPPLAHNWLRDLELANHLFTADPAAMYVQDLGLDPDLVPVAQQHLAFFNSKARRGALAELVADDRELSAEDFPQRLIAATLGAQATWPDIAVALLQQEADGKETGIRALEKFDLADTLWAAFADTYGYRASEPNLRTLAAHLLHTHTQAVLAQALPTSTPATPLTTEERRALAERKAQCKRIGLFLNRWQQNRLSHDSFLALSKQVYDQSPERLDQLLLNQEIEDLRGLDTFQAIDEYILRRLGTDLQRQSIGAREVSAAREMRIGSVWLKANDALAACYDALAAAAKLLDLIRGAVYKQPDALATWHSYVSTLAQVDEAYRNFHYAYRRHGGAGIDVALVQTVDTQYTENFVYHLNAEWSDRLADGDATPAETFGALSLPRQRHFFAQQVQPALQTMSRLFVIVSDGMAYASALGFRDRLNDQTLYKARLDAQLGVAPSYTQLGMAALLPHRELSIEPASTTVLADGRPTSGTAARSAVLSEAMDGKGLAISAEDFLSQTADRDAGRQWLKPYELVYVYSDTIDKAGENAPETLPAATEAEFAKLLGLLKRISGMNGTRVLITSDHGYLWQHSDLQDIHFLDTGRPEAEGYKTNRRFVLGEDFGDESGVYGFSASELGLAGDTGIAIAKGMLRFRHRGNSGKYAHGGMSLQELAIPVLDVRLRQDKRLQSQPVPVRIISLPAKLTTVQLPLKLYQDEPIGVDYTSVRASVGLFAADGTLLSTLQQVEFASSSDEPRNREQSVTLQINEAAEAYDQQQVFVRLYPSHERQLSVLVLNEKLAEQSLRLVRGGFGRDFDF